MNELDAFLRDYALPALKAAGYTKKARIYRLANDIGDVAVVQFRPFQLGNLVDFVVDVGICPVPVSEFTATRFGREERPPDAASGAWQHQWLTPIGDKPFSDSTWSVRELAERDDLGQSLSDALTTEIVPLLSALLDRAVLLDVTRQPSLVPGDTTMGARGIVLALLADYGPSVALDLAMSAADKTHPFDQSALAFARQRLAARGYDDEQWRAGVWQNPEDPYVRLATVLESDVDQALIAAGFTRTGTRYQLVSDRGDVAVIELTPSQTSSATEVRFRVETAVVPGPELEWRRYHAARKPDTSFGLIEADASTGWLRASHPPPAAHAIGAGPVENLTATLWAFTPATASGCGDQLADVLTREAMPRLLQFLDRSELLATVLDPETKAYIPYAHAEIILLVDDGPSEQLENALQITEAYRGPIDPELATWARQRLAARG